MADTSSQLRVAMVDLRHPEMFRDFPAHQNPDVRAFRHAVQKDLCVYCGGHGGTLEHLSVRGRADRWDTSGWAGACAACNAARSRGGRGGRGQHRSPLDMLVLRDDERRRWLRMHPEALLAVGDLVSTATACVRVRALPGGAQVELEGAGTCTDVLMLRAPGGGPLPRLAAAAAQWVAELQK